MPVYALGVDCTLLAQKRAQPVVSDETGTASMRIPG
jgi:hypothetical protein